MEKPAVSVFCHVCNWHPLRPLGYEVIDIECAAVFYADTESLRDDYKSAIELMGHRALVREIKS